MNLRLGHQARHDPGAHGGKRQEDSEVAPLTQSDGCRRNVHQILQRHVVAQRLLEVVHGLPEQPQQEHAEPEARQPGLIDPFHPGQRRNEKKTGYE